MTETILKKPLTLLLSLLLLLSSNLLKAQQETDTLKAKASYFKVSASYLSNGVYYGRKDSLTLPYISGSLSYHHKSGLYLDFTLSYLVSKDVSQIDATALTGGYEFNSTNKKLSGSLYATKYFYSLTNPLAELFSS